MFSITTPFAPPNLFSINNIAVARQFGNKKKNFNGEQLWARGYAVSTVGFEEQMIKNYIKNQECLDGIGSNEIGEFSVMNIGSL
jgi:putative transposase